ncbi:MAG: protein translocase subunit SecF [Gammaproteobacteria bacterium]|nr:protein translocase subunit SecF [Gammaproteobacteria bacterium]
MNFVTRLYRGETSFDFVGAKRMWLTMSSSFVLVSLLAIIIFGLNLSLDFKGGVAVDVNNVAGVDVATVRNALTPLGLADAKIQMLAGGDDIRVQVGALSPEESRAFQEAVAAVSGVSLAEVSVEEVGPTFGAEITKRAVIALVVFLAAVVLFMTWRLEWKMAVSGITALFHDLIITFGVYALTRFEVTPATIIGVLTILGYSLYDTVVVFDKVKENIEELHTERMTLTELVNRSMNQVLMRSINTSLTSLLPVGSLLFVGSFLLGAHTLRDFALALFVGIAAGTYSSIGVASPILATWKEHEDEWARVRRRKERGRGDGTPRRAKATVVETTDTAPKPSQGAPRRQSGAAPRPPKKGKKGRRR